MRSQAGDASASRPEEGDRRVRGDRRLRVARAIRRHPQIRGGAHRLARDSIVVDRSNRNRELLPEPDRNRVSSERNHHDIVFEAMFERSLATPVLMTAATAKYQVPELRLSTT